MFSNNHRYLNGPKFLYDMDKPHFEKERNLSSFDLTSLEGNDLSTVNLMLTEARNGDGTNNIVLENDSCCEVVSIATEINKPDNFVEEIINRFGMLRKYIAVIYFILKWPMFVLSKLNTNHTHFDGSVVSEILHMQNNPEYLNVCECDFCNMNFKEARIYDNSVCDNLLPKLTSNPHPVIDIALRDKYFHVNVCLQKNIFQYFISF